MNVEQDRVVSFHYVISDEQGQALESTRAGEAISVLHGSGNIMRGIEQALAGRKSGDRFELTLSPEQAFGQRREGNTQRVSKKYFPDGSRLRAGMTVDLHTKEGPRPVTVLKVGHKTVDVDLNHPHAGRTLSFDIEVVDVRTATAEEIAHRHVHGPGGHHH